MMTRLALRLLPVTVLLATPLAATAQTPSELTPRIAEVRTFANGPGEAVWAGYGAAPFSLLITGPESELLLCRPTAPPGFEALERDPTTGCGAYSRPRSALPDTLLAAMPIFGPPSTIVGACSALQPCWSWAAGWPCLQPISRTRGGAPQCTGPPGA